jgi:TonB family protein
VRHRRDAVPAGPPRPARLPRPPRLSKAGNLIYWIDPIALDGKRISGRVQVVPDDEDKMRIRSLPKRGTRGAFELCLDESGRYESGTLVHSTGLPRYDAKIIQAMMRWAYSPQLVDGVAVPICTRITFIYTQA